jgi:phosphatidylglycerophosphate synthase
MEDTDRKQTPMAVPQTPLKSALKSPGAPPKAALFSPTFKEEQILEKREVLTEKVQAQDLKSKFRVRTAKIMLRGINFSCSLIVVSMLATTFTIFNATKAIPPRNGLPPWASPTPLWPQILLLVIACISLLMSIVIFYAYWKGGHKRAEKVAVYYTTFAVIFFLFSIIMWAIGAAAINQTRSSSGGVDIWGWSCKDNKRRELFQNDVAYSLICRLQEWSLVCCLIEVVVEVFTIAVYGIVFYRFWSKRKLRKSMAIRDRARSDLYLAQLRTQSAPNTPGFAPFSPRDGGWQPPPGHPSLNPLSDAENGEAEGAQIVTVGSPRAFTPPKPFMLQAPPIRVQGATPKVRQDGFSSTGNSPSSPLPPSSPTYFETQQSHVPAAPGEQQYAAVPIPGSYISPALASPSAIPVEQPQMTLPPQQAPQQQNFGGFDFGDAIKKQ